MSTGVGAIRPEVAAATGTGKWLLAGVVCAVVGLVALLAFPTAGAVSVRVAGIAAVPFFIATGALWLRSRSRPGREGENTRLRAEVRSLRSALADQNRLATLGTLSATVAHEIRNPLVAIRTFFQLAPDRLDDEEFVTSYLEVTRDAVERISGLVTELLAVARAPARVPQDMDLDEAAARAVKLLSAHARQHKVELGRIPAVKPLSISADPSQVQQVLLNLLLNAVQASGEGGKVTVAARLVRHGGKSFGQAEVRDTGPGVPDHVRETIFDPFFSTKPEGTGLGLAVVDQLVSVQGGFVDVTDCEGGGSCFRVHFPACSVG